MGYGLIKFWTIFRISRHSLLQHKLRSALSVLGVICGVVAVLSLISIGEGAKEEVIEQIERLGTRNIYIRAVNLTADQRRKAREGLSRGLSLYDIERILAGCPQVQALSWLKETPASVLDAPKDLSPPICAVSPSYLVLKNIVLHRGRFITDADVENANLVCVLGSELAGVLGEQGEPGGLLRIENQLFTVVGILGRIDLKSTKTAPIAIRNYNNMVFIPIGTERSISKAASNAPTEWESELTEILLQVKDIQQVSPAAALVKRILEISHNKIKDYQVLIPQELLNQARKTQRTFNLVLGAIAGVSLLVGGIGIMNIMLATITERFREIGIRRAVGATRLDIVLQFLVEAVILTLSGGVVGVGVGIGATNLIVTSFGWRVAITPRAILLPLVMSVLVGLFFGLYPAYRAARLDPVTALRHE